MKKLLIVLFVISITLLIAGVGPAAVSQLNEDWEGHADGLHPWRIYDNLGNYADWELRNGSWGSLTDGEALQGNQSYSIAPGQTSRIEIALGDKPFEETWWIISDTHIGTDSNALPRLKAAVADVNSLGISQKAIVLGDLVHDDPVYLPSYENAMNELNHPWIDVLGNHDYDRYGSGARVKPRTFFSEMIGGVRFIFLSDDGMWNGGNVIQGYQTETNLMQDQNDWFISLLEENPEIPSIIMSHQSLRRMYEVSTDDGPCYWDSSRRGWLQENWGNYNIPMWIRGHRHAWALEENYMGHGFVDISRGDWPRVMAAAFS